MITLTAQQIYDIFIHRKDVYSVQQSNGAYFPTKLPIVPSIIQHHIDGKITIGAYCLNTDNTVKWACVDIDSEEPDSRRLLEEAQIVYDQFPDFPRMLEFSGRKGYHIWIFFWPPEQANYAQRLVKSRLNRVNMNRYEVFPKQTELNEGRKYGNLVKLPMATHRVSGRKSQILKMEGVL